MKFILLFIFIVNAYASVDESTLDCKKQFAIAWQANIEGNKELSNNIAQKCIKELNIVMSWFNILEAKILFSTNEYEKTLNKLNESRVVIENTYKISKKVTENTNLNYESQKFFYLQMLSYSGLSNYKLKKYNEAIVDFNLYLKEVKNPLYMQYLASCYSYLNLYSEAISTLNQAYKIKPSDEIASYIASVYAKNKNVEKSIYWLKTISDKDIIKWIDMDDNFNNIRSTHEFKKFLSHFGEVKD